MKHLIKLALIALATVAAYFVFGFTSSVAPLPVAVAAAGSLVGTYIGLAFATIPDRQRARAGRVALGAMLIEAAYGSLYVLALQYPDFFANPPWFVAVPVAILHGAAFSVLAYFVSLFVVNEAESAQEPAHAAHGDALDAVRLLVQELRSVPALPAPQETFARPMVVVAPPQVVPVVVPVVPPPPQVVPPPVVVHMAATTPQTADPWRCPACGTTATTGQRGAAKTHGYYYCKGNNGEPCGKKIEVRK